MRHLSTPILAFLLLFTCAACDDPVYGTRAAVLDGEDVGGAGVEDASEGEEVGALPDAALPGKLPPPLFLYAEVEGACPEALDPAEAAAIFAQPGPVWSGEVWVGEECTGAGGEYLLWRDGERAAWLGGHACYFVEEGLRAISATLYGVIRVRETGTIEQQLDPGLCLGFPGEPPGLRSDVRVLAFALFTDPQQAAAFAAGVGQP